MEIKKAQSVIESILFAAGREVETKEIMMATELTESDVYNIMQKLKQHYQEEDSGIELIKINTAYQLCSKKENHSYVCQVLDKRQQPSLSPAALEVISIIAYNPKITRAEIEAIRGVNSDASMYKLLEYELIKEAGKADAPRQTNDVRSKSKIF